MIIPYLMLHFDRIIVVEPVDYVPFNRGWIKNVGFLLSFAGPDDSVYFHDADTLPTSDTWVYPPVPRGCVVHLYGHRHCLGGIVGVDPAVFNYIGGFPHTDAWGGEDRQLQSACIKNNIRIDRSLFKERFKTFDVVELAENGSVEPAEIGRKALMLKCAKYKHVDLFGCLHKASYKLASSLKTNGVRHCVVAP